MHIRTVRDIPDELKALASDLRQLGENAWADRITLALSMRKQGRELLRAVNGLLAEFAGTPVPAQLGYAYRVMAIRHAATALQIGHRLKPPTLHRSSPGTLTHDEGFQVRRQGLNLIYREGPRTMTIALEPAHGGSICYLDLLQWDDATTPLEGNAREVIQQRLIAALLLLDASCRIYCE